MFDDRKHAGELLAKALNEYKGKNAIVFALPRGGVAVAAEIRRILKLPLKLVIARKIGHPTNPEYAIAAISESGLVVENKSETSNIDKDWLREAYESESKESKRRRMEYSAEKMPTSLAGITAIIADDGVATGLTLKAAVKEISSLKPAKIVIALPVGPADTIEELKKLADEVVVINNDKNFLGAIGAYYHDFTQVSDSEVTKIIDNVKEKKKLRR